MRYVLILVLAVMGIQSQGVFGQSGVGSVSGESGKANQQTGSGGGIYGGTSNQQASGGIGRTSADYYQQAGGSGVAHGGVVGNLQQTQSRSGSLGTYLSSSANSNSANVRFSRFKKVDDDKKDSIREDSAIMNHMISKELPLKNSRSALGVNYAKSYGKNEITYNDHGLTFVYYVPFQLLPGGKSGKGTVDAEEPKSPWEKAKNELRRPFRVGIVDRSAAGSTRDFYDPVRQGYNQEYVDQIAQQIRTALNSSGNIRDLADGDTITVFVYGASINPGMRSVMAWRVDWKSLKAGGAGMSAPLEETSYEEETNSQVNAVQYYQSTDGR